MIVEEYSQKFYGESIDNETIIKENEFIMNYYNKINFDNKSCCDYGCGSGFWTYYLSKLCSNTIGTDISDESINFCNENFASVKFVTLEQALMQRYDYIFVNWVLQEITDEINFKITLDRLSSICKEKGRLFIVDNISPDESKTQLYSKTEYGSVYSYKTGEKIRFFGIDQLKIIFLKIGFELKEYYEFEESFLLVLEKSIVN